MSSPLPRYKSSLKLNGLKPIIAWLAFASQFLGPQLGRHEVWVRPALLSSDLGGFFTHMSSSLAVVAGYWLGPHAPITQNTYMRLLRVVSPYGLVWSSSQHGHWDPRVSISRENQVDAVLHFMILNSKFTQHPF